MKITLIKTGPKTFAPADEETDEWASKVKLGSLVHSDFKRVRNAAFHRKGFSLLNLAFEHWTPGEIDSKFGTPQKNFDQFRSDLTILAGFYKIVIRVDGSTRIIPKSLSFSSMDDIEFEAWYNSVINVILERIPTLGKTKEEIDDLVNKVMAYT